MSRYAAKGSISTKYNKTVSMRPKDYYEWVESGESIEVMNYWTCEVLGIVHPTAPAEDKITRYNGMLVKVIKFERI